MATRFYLPSTGTTPAVTPAASSAWTVTTGAGYLPAGIAKSNAALAAGAARTSAVSGAYRNVLDRVYVSAPLAAQTIAAGTFSAVLKAVESTTTANGWLQIIIRVVSSDGATERGVIYAGSTASVTPSATAGAENQEYGTTASTRIKSSLTTSAVTAQSGDLLVIELGTRYNASATNSTYTLTYGDPSATADYALTSGLTTNLVPWVELSSNVTFGGTAPGVSTLVDTFDTQDTSKWSFGPAAAVTGGRLVATLNSAWSGYGRSLTTYDLTGSAVRVEIPVHPTGPSYTNTYIQLTNTGAVGGTTNGTLFQFENTTISVAQYLNGAYSTVTSGTYSATNHRWLRIRESGGSLIFDVSPDGVTWTQFHSYAAPFPINSLYVELGAGGPPTSSPSAAQFDNLNSTASSVRIGTAAGSWAFTGVAAGVAPSEWTGVGLGQSALGTSPLGGGSSPSSPVGTAAGSWSFVGTAAGKRDPKGAATGTITFAGTAAGKRAPKATSVGAWSFVGAAAGSRPARGTAVGSWSFTGAASGKRAPKATGVGSWAFTGQAAGLTTRQGAANGSLAWTGQATGFRPTIGTKTGAGFGSWSFVGNAAGSRTARGTATGLLAWAGVAAGATPRRGSGSGAWSFTGTAAGQAPRNGVGVGSWAFAGQAVGLTTRRGTATGLLSWTGLATGIRPVVGGKLGQAAGSWNFTGVASGSRTARGTGTGLLAWVGAAAGIRPAVGGRLGQASGSWNFTGAAQGQTTRRGTASGSLTYVGTASGTKPTLPPRVGTASGTFTWTGTATGRKTPRGTAAGAIAFAGMATGATRRTGTAVGTWTYTGFATSFRGEARDIVVFVGSPERATLSIGEPLRATLSIGPRE